MFDSARLKLDWARLHIGKLEDAFQRFRDSNPYAILIKPKEDGGSLVILSPEKPLPTEVGLILGDAVHNLRCVLDHATWELFGFDQGVQDRWTKLPTGNNKVDYESGCRGIATPRADTKQFFVDLGVFNGGPRDAIYQMHLLDNIDKHVVICPTVTAGHIVEARVVNAQGVPVVTLRNSAFGGPMGESFPLMNIDAGMTPEFDQNSVTADLWFGPDQPFALKSIVPTLRQLCEDVEVVLTAFETFVRTRKP